MTFVEGRPPIAETGRQQTDARAVMAVIDEIINKVYLPFRGQEGYKTERAVLVAEPHAPHRENNAEHSWHLVFTARILWDQQQELGLTFGEDFDISKAVQFAVDHDVIEVWSGDVDALTQDADLLQHKAAREHAAMDFIQAEHPALEAMAERWREYDQKTGPEAQYVSDLDKILATRIIFLDGGKKWNDWQGVAVTRDHMCTRVRSKLFTPLGHSLFDVLESDISDNQHILPVDRDVQLRIDDV